MNSPTISNCVLALLIIIKLVYGNNINLNEETNVQEKITYNGDQVLRVEQVNSKQRKTIKDLENRGLLQKWYSTPISVDVMIKNENKNIVKSVLNNGSLSFDLFIDDVQRAIDEENLPVTINDEQLGRREHNVTFENYHTLKDIYHYIDYISQEYPNIVEIENIGQSFEGAPLRVVRIKLDKNSSTTNAIWIDGGIHAREWISVSSVLYLINELVYNQDLLKTYMKNIEFHILPIVNPDGYLIGKTIDTQLIGESHAICLALLASYVYSHQKERLWRKNRNKHPGSSCFGTDLNRNWAYHWGESGASKYKCAEIFRGAKAGSEPETQAIVQYIMKDPSKFKGFLTFHSYGQYILYPWGYARRVPSDHIDLQRVGQAMAAAIKEATSFEYTVGNSASLLYPAAGASDDWAKGVAKIKYAYTFELRDTGKNGFILPASHIVPTGKEAIIAATILAEEISLENSITT